MVLIPKFTEAFLASTPFVEVTAKEVVRQGAVVFEMRNPRLDMIAKALSRPSAPVVVKLDGWPKKRICSRVFIRIGAQGVGCSLRCLGCDAADLPGYNLTRDEMVYQVVHVLASSYVQLREIKRVTVAFMGTGEPLANPHVASAIEFLHEMFRGIGFIVSTTGPKRGEDVFNSLMKLVTAKLPIGLQISVPEVIQLKRMVYTQDRLRGSELALCWTLSQLSCRASEFLETTQGQRMAHANLVVAESLADWTPEEYHELGQKFGPKLCVVKVSPEGKKSSVILRTKVATRLSAVRSGGWPSYVYDPIGNGQGLGCASLEILQ